MSDRRSRRSRRSRRASRRAAINPDASTQRQALRALGMLLTIVGGAFAGVGLVSFFGSFGSGAGPPELFWCAFVGLPLFGIGLALLKYGYMGKIFRYAAGETAPVVRDSFDELARGSRSGIRAVTSAVAEGLRGEAGTLRCGECGADNDVDAKFCMQCGAGMAVAKACSSCGTENDPDAQFCDSCGERFAP